MHLSETEMFLLTLLLSAPYVLAVVAAALVLWAFWRLSRRLVRARRAAKAAAPPLL
jgi:hypothetical protein